MFHGPMTVHGSNSNFIVAPVSSLEICYCIFYIFLLSTLQAPLAALNMRFLVRNEREFLVV